MTPGPFDPREPTGDAGEPFDLEAEAGTERLLRDRLRREAARIDPSDRSTDLFAAAAQGRYPEPDQRPDPHNPRQSPQPDTPGVEMSDQRSDQQDQSPQRRSRWWQPVLAAAAVAVIAVAVIMVVNRPGQQVADPGPATISTTATASTSTVLPSSTASSSTTDAPTSTGAPTPTLSDDGAPIWIALPAQGLAVPPGQPFDIAGKATVFEATVTWELRQGSTVVEKGFTNASIGAPERGDWTVTVAPVPNGTYEFHAFENSAKDGSVLHDVSRPITVG